MLKRKRKCPGVPHIVTHCAGVPHIVTLSVTICHALSHIVQECHTLYADPEHGLISIAETLGLKLLAPRKKITIMLIGNHSAGKSSFINW